MNGGGTGGQRDRRGKRERDIKVEYEKPICFSMPNGEQEELGDDDGKRIP